MIQKMFKGSLALNADLVDVIYCFILILSYNSFKKVDIK